MSDKPQTTPETAQSSTNPAVAAAATPAATSATTAATPATSTPAKTGTTPATTPAGATTAPATTPSGAATPSSAEKEKSLNVNAKSFVPKMDSSIVERSVVSPSHSARSGGSGAQPHVAVNPAGSPQRNNNRSNNQQQQPPPPPMMPPPPPGFPGGAMPPGFPPGFGFMPGMPMGGPGMMSPNGMPMGFPPMAMPGMKGYPQAMMMGQMPPPLGAMPPPPSPNGRPMANGATTFVPSSPLSGGMGPHTPLTPVVQVGNATLVAKRSKAPPKFGCVLLAGVTGVGKTTIGNAIVQELSADTIPWKFFCGADHLKDAPTAKPAPWDTTRSVFDGLGEYLDALLAKQATEPIRGLLIDKQLRGVEDLYYLTSLLRSKGLLLWGVLGMDCANDEILASRLGNTAGMNEKIKFHRVIYSRIQEASKAVGLWRTVDASGTKADSLKHLRTMVLGCSSQSPTKQFNASLYHESPIPMVDNYSQFASVMANLFTIIPRNAKGVAMFPGQTVYTPLASSMLDAKKNPLRDYAVRRKVDGTKYILFYDGAKLYLIPRHMRCVFEMSQDAWLGVHLSNTGKFVVDGELAKMSKDRSKEKFVVYDVIHWADKGSSTNTVARASWKDRQERLKTNLCSEGTAFFPKKGDIVVVHQMTVDEPRSLAHLLEPTDYPCDGLIFHSTTRRDELPIMWRPPESITVDFRLGTGTKNDDGGWTFIAEVFDTNLAKYNQFRTDTIDITGGYRPTTIEGAIVACSLDLSGSTPSWVFQRVRSDLIAASLKVQVDEVLKHCIVPKQSMLDFVASLEARYVKEQGKTAAAAAATAGGDGAASASAATTPAGTSASPAKPTPTLGGATQPSAAQPTTSSSSSGGGKAAGSLGAGRGAFGSALATEGGNPPSMRDIVTGAHKSTSSAPVAPAATTTTKAEASGLHHQTKHDKDSAMMTDAEKLSSVVASVKVKNLSANTPANDVAMLAGMVGSVSVVGPGSKGNSASRDDDGDRSEEEPKKRGQRECSECCEIKHGRIDKRNNKVYCYDCWALEGVEFCTECKDFATGRRETFSRRKKGDFFCDSCWAKFDEEEAEEERQKRRDAGRRRARD